MNLRMASVLLVVGLLAGCEGCGNDAPTATTGGGQGSSTGTETTGGAATETAEAPAEADPGAPPTLGLSVEPGFEGAASLIVENRGSEAVELSSALVLEREEDGAFAPVSGIAGLALRFDCVQEPPECLTLVPGAALHPPPWNGMLGDAQCVCTRCADAPTGTYRFVVTTCGGGHRVTSPAFTR
ncbi:MAG: hypothetical protein DRJ42_27165 [Deltaproteobacteria bacterium]|nr:MAG: hypothetical protein DRJ42_27165 [Deltaproteobacteria bacterium]